MLLRPIIATAVSALVFVAASGTASAQEKAQGFGAKGQLIFSAERLVPLFAYTNSKVSQDSNNSTSVSTTQISLLPNISASGNGRLAVGNFYNVPRVAFDYSFGGLTVGGSIYAAFTPGSSNTQKTNGTSVSTDADTATLFGIAPRVGYILGLSDIFAFWPRGGFTYGTFTAKSPDNGNGNSSSTNVHQFGLNLEAQFALVPTPHFFFYFGPVVDIPLTGSASVDSTTQGRTTTVSQDFSQFHFGITAGLGGWFGGT